MEQIKDYDYYSHVANEMWVSKKKKITKDNEVIELKSEMILPKEKIGVKYFLTAFGTVYVNPIDEKNYE